ncbi:protein SODIUM POTASSIUM ROOT DEFECTIVE 2-like [Abrus precatorius]|uniref:Protein SODIUM POTASSIUM ROOT DEFECTIVE 2-like n=1 Tax=Abrus precatorius TaxID=3816 RepID=A0A8B8M4W5_ABRPR|nr:protein SODIUM POTASSIUM ROOT DEFECTIVE 2-like [Abrus precatorius]
MKRIDIFCASQASTAICLSMDQASCSSSNTIQLGGRTIDRHNPIINDSRRSTSKSLTAPCSSSQPPINPKPYHDLHKAKKNSSLKPNDQDKKSAIKGHDQKKKSTAEKVTEHVTNTYSSKPIDITLRRSWHKPPTDSITPSGSTRSLLSDKALLDGSSDYDPVLALTTVNNKTSQVFHRDETNPAPKNSSSSSNPKSGSPDQVVVLRVSLHCKGCEGKVRKHLSRMQGVSSFNIDFAAKKVTVIGDVTPLSVLASISKVKNAQLWPASASAVGSGIVETKKKSLSD